MVKKHLKPEIIRKLYIQQHLSIKEISDTLGISFWKVYSLMKKSSIPRRNRIQASYLAYKNKPRFRFKCSLTNKEKLLKVAGLMLYWAEGTFLGNTVDFTNSNPKMIRIFLRFLREICGVSQKRLRIYLYAYSNQNINKLRLFWHKTTNVPISQFTKPFIRSYKVNSSNRFLKYGLIHIRYNDKQLLNSLKYWLENFVDGQVPKWLKGTDCKNCSA